MINLDWPLMKNSICDHQKKVMTDFINGDNRFTNGERVREFEGRWAEWMGTEEAVFVNSGGSANLLLLDAVAELFFKEYPRVSFKRRANTELSYKNLPMRVLVPSCTWGTTIAPLMQVGYDIEYCDIDLDTYSFCRDNMLRIRESKDIDVVWITHLLGSPSNIELIKNIFPEALILEDCCESHGARFNNQKVGTFGIGSTFSFYFGHHMTTVEGGIVCTNNKDLYELMRMKRSHGLAREASPGVFKTIKDSYPDLDERFLFPTVGYNLRNVEINAVLGLEQLKHLDNWINVRKDNLKMFNKILSKYGDEFRPVKEDGNSSFALPFVCKDKAKKDKLQKHLSDSGVETRPFLVGNIVRQPFISHPTPEAFVNSEFLHNNAFYIGNNQFINKDNMAALEDVIANVYS